MFSVVAFKEHHLLPLIDEPINAGIRDWFLSGLAKEMEKTNSVTVLMDERPILCGGITDYWVGRGQVWSVFSETCREHFVPVFRIIQAWLRKQLIEKYNRIELSVDVTFEKGRRRAEMLGFKLECPLAKKYLPGGEDVSLYSLVRGD